MRLVDKIRKAKRVYIIGNGGSFANAQHICNDLEGCGIKAHTLNPASLTRWANDMDYALVFSLWLDVHGEPGDLLIALSGSGTSPNIVNACVTAERLGMDIWREFGAEKGLGMQDAEEAQIRLGHDLMRELKK